MYCNRCGHANPDGASFCSRCGTGLQVSSTAQSVGAARAAVTPPAAMTPLAPAMAGAGLAAGSSDFMSHANGAKRQELATDDGTFDEEAWAAVLGPKNIDYYLPRFRAIAEGGPTPRWHWPAFFVTWYWLLYRKMWGLSFVYLFGTWLLTAVPNAIAGAAGSGSGSEATLSIFVLATLFVIPPLLANQLYYRQCAKKMQAARQGNRSRSSLLAALRTSGGTSRVAVIAVGVLALIVLIGVVAAVSLPAYNDYTKRAKTAAAAHFGRQTVEAVVEHYRRTRQAPAYLEDLPNAPTRPASVSSVDIDQNSGMVILQIRGIGQMEFAPQLQGETLTVSCASANIARNLLPASCR